MLMFTMSCCRFATRFAPLVLAITVAGLTSACGDDDILEPDVQTIRLVISGVTAPIDIDAGATVSPTILITPGAHTVTATFLRANGDIEPLVTGTEFELRLENLNPAIATFTRTGAFTGTLTGLAVGSDEATIELFHLEELHPDFGPKGVTITVQ
jgi:hypothetical protein